MGKKKQLPTVTVPGAQLQRILAAALKAVSKSPQLPVLENVRLKACARAGHIWAHATNLEVSVVARTDGIIDADIDITVPARTLADLAKNMSGEPIELIYDPEDVSLRIKQGRSSTKVKGIPSDQFPPMPQPDGAAMLTLPAEQWKSLLGVEHAISTNEARPSLMGAYVTLNGKAEAAATDGFRIAIRKDDTIQVEQEVSCLIPGQSIKLILAMMAGDVTGYFVPGSMVMFQDESGLSVAARLIEGNYPDYSAIIPTECKTTVTVSAAAFSKALKLAEVIAKEVGYVARLEFTNGDGEGSDTCTVFAASNETGKHEATLPCKIKGPDLKIAFNTRFVRDAIAGEKGDITIKMTTEDRPALIEHSCGIEVVMPMHLASVQADAAEAIRQRDEAAE
jgi:DNA polymerase III subunit beta